MPHARLDAALAAAGDTGLAVSAFVELALYDPDDGFYERGGRAGRRGDFLTAPEVGPLFGAVVARALDRWWAAAGRPDPFVVVEWGAGPGTLARSVTAADSEVGSTGVLRWCAVERSAEQRRSHPDHPLVGSGATPAEARAALGSGPAGGTDVVVANELLDNLPFDVHERTDNGWAEVRVVAGSGGPETTLAATADDVRAVLDRLVPVADPGVRVPWQPRARAWLAEVEAALAPDRTVVVDYGDTTAALAARGSWLRTHRGHEAADDWLDEPGSCDITADVALDQLQLDRPATSCTSQADWLRAHGIDELVEEGRRIWTASAGVGDLAALRARSRIREAEALCDPAGMGAFHVLEWARSG